MREELIIKHCAPTLAGIKTGSIFSCIFESDEEIKENLRRLNRIFVSRGIKIIPLRIRENRVLMYVFRPEFLKKDLKNAKTLRVLENMGYCCQSPEKCVIRLIKRLNESIEFPHELGFFLGFPPEDVCGFIENRGCCCKCSGYWKVYDDEEKAKDIFKQYKNCTELYKSMFEKGSTLENLVIKSGSCIQ
ncbi:MAG: DUF3793 domain-containing protein [Clostridiales bacterium]|nr:MAG: DUF3793 domain-containing protein [Clostridiales bacterium]